MCRKFDQDVQPHPPASRQADMSGRKGRSHGLALSPTRRPLARPILLPGPPAMELERTGLATDPLGRQEVIDVPPLSLDDAESPPEVQRSGRRGADPGERVEHHVAHERVVADYPLRQ